MNNFVGKELNMLIFKNQFKINVLKLFVIFLASFLLNSSLYADTRKTIYTPEGKNLY